MNRTLLVFSTGFLSGWLCCTLLRRFASRAPRSPSLGSPRSAPAALLANSNSNSNSNKATAEESAEDREAQQAQLELLQRLPLFNRYYSYGYEVGPEEGQRLFNSQSEDRLKVLHVVYWSPNYLILNKQWDVYIDGQGEHTIEKLVTIHLPEHVRRRKLRMTHQLDFATSGIFCLAWSRTAAAKAAKGFEQRTVRKEYEAIVRGHFPLTTRKQILQQQQDQQQQGEPLPVPRHTFTDFIAKKPDGTTRMMVADPALDPTAKAAITEAECIEHGFIGNIPVSRMALFPKTGRTHQLRVHLSHNGYPILGDWTYGDDKDHPRMCLHARRLQIPLESEKVTLWEADPPFPPLSPVPEGSFASSSSASSSSSSSASSASSSSSSASSAADSAELLDADMVVVPSAAAVQQQSEGDDDGAEVLVEDDTSEPSPRASVTAATAAAAAAAAAAKEQQRSNQQGKQKKKKN